MELLPVREAKKEQAAYEAQIRKDACSDMESEMEDELEEELEEELEATA
jgi:hypothetical protein